MQLTEANPSRRIMAIRRIASDLEKKDQQALINALKDPSVSIRIKAAQGLRIFNDKEVCDALAEACYDKDNIVRINAAFSLSHLCDQRVMPCLIAAVKEILTYQTEIKISLDQYIERCTSALIRMGKPALIPIEKELLHDDHIIIRAIAIRAISNIDEQDSVRLLLEATYDTDDSLRNLAVNGLANFKNTRAITRIFELLTDNDNKVRISAIRACGLLGNRNAIPHLILLLSDPVYDVRSEAIKALGIMGEKQGLEAVSNMLKDENQQIQLDSMNAISNIQDRWCLNTLLTLAPNNNDDKEYIDKYIRLIAKYNDNDVLPYLDTYYESDIVEIKLLCAQIFARRKKEVDAMIYLIETLKNPDINCDSWIQYSIANFGEAAVLPLINELNNDNLKVRIRTIKTLAALKDERAIYDLSRLIQDDVEKIRIEAVRALGEISAEQSYTSIVNVLKNDTSAVVRVEAARALGKLNKKPVLSDIADMFDDKDEYIRTEIIRTINKQQVPGTQYLLIKALDDNSPLVQGAAASAFANLGDIKAKSPLLAFLRLKEQYYIRSSAVVGIAGINDQEVIERLMEIVNTPDDPVAEIACDTLININNINILSQMRILLDSKIPGVRKNAIKILGYKNDREAVLPLMNLLENESNNAIRIEIINALARIGNTQCFGLLIKLLNDPNISIRITVIKALGVFQQENILNHLSAALEDDSIFVRAAAINSIGNIPGEQASDLLITALVDPHNIHLHGNICEILAERKDKLAINSLVNILLDNNAGPHYAAAKALAEITGIDLEQDGKAWKKWLHELDH